MKKKPLHMVGATRTWSYVFLELWILHTRNKEDLGGGGCNTQQKKMKMLHLLGAMGALDTKNTKDREGANATNKKNVIRV